MGYTTFKPFLGSWGVYDFPILYFALLGVTGASWSNTLLYESDDLFGFLQCLVFCPFYLLLDDLAQFFFTSSITHLLLHTFTFFGTIFGRERKSFSFFRFSHRYLLRDQRGGS
jgi:hypothetical protein